MKTNNKNGKVLPTKATPLGTPEGSAYEKMEANPPDRGGMSLGADRAQIDGFNTDIKKRTAKIKKRTI